MAVFTALPELAREPTLRLDAAATMTTCLARRRKDLHEPSFHHDIPAKTDGYGTNDTLSFVPRSRKNKSYLRTAAQAGRARHKKWKVYPTMFQKTKELRRKIEDHPDVVEIKSLSN